MGNGGDDDDQVVVVSNLSSAFSFLNDVNDDEMMLQWVVSFRTLYSFPPSSVCVCSRVDVEVSSTQRPAPEEVIELDNCKWIFKPLITFSLTTPNDLPSYPLCLPSVLTTTS